MLDLQKTPSSTKTYLSSLTPVYRSNGNSVSKWSDFDFWGDQGSTRVSDNYANSDDYGACSSPRFCTSPLLPRNHHYSSYPPSPKSRLQAILDGRKELMEIIQDMPESSYELSFKDIVADEQQEAERKDDVAIDERRLKYKPSHVDIMKQKKKIMSRSESMDSGVFLLKMFFPTSLGTKGKSTACSKVSQKPPLERSDKTGDKEWWKVRFLSIGDGKKSGKTSISGSISSRSSSGGSSREDYSNFTPGCWYFHKKCRSPVNG